MANERLTFDELAAILRVQPCTIRSWAMRGLPCVPAGRLRFYNLAEVEAWLREVDRTRAPRKKSVTKPLGRPKKSQPAGGIRPQDWHLDLISDPPTF